MMDLSTTYLGMRLSSPLMPGASPLVDDLDTVRRLEDAGAAAIVMHSLFEEQVEGEPASLLHHTQSHGEAFPEALSYFPSADLFALGPEDYLEQIRRIKQSVKLPVFGSLNGTTPGGWIKYARLMAEAGADAIELNPYTVATEAELSGADVEQRTIDLVRAVKESVRVPVAVKLSPYWSSVAHLAGRLAQAGADGLILFNRFYQADIDVEELEVRRSLRLSDPSELVLRLRWLAALSGRVKASLAATGGVHGAADALKAVMAGADAVQMVSALLRRGPGHLGQVREELARFLEEHGYESLAQARGSMSLERCPDPAAYERAQYIRILQSWDGREE
jgi:dihydroorotate dehydrogenase (fumarate)